jgi:hypothetical protein
MKATHIYQAGGTKMTLGELRGFMTYVSGLADETPVAISGGSDQRDGPWWQLTVTIQEEVPG